MPFEEPDIVTVRVLLPTRVGSAGTGGQFTLNASTGSVSLVAGSNISLSQNASTITIIGAAGGTGGATFSLNASTGSVSLVAGAGIGFASNLSTITISNTAGAATITGTMAGNTLGAASTTLTIGNSLSVSGAGAVSVGASAGTLTISGGSTLVAGVNLSLTTGGSSITLNASSNAISNVSLLNASSGALSISAGAGIGIGQANSTITISASVQTATVSLTALGNTTSSSSGTYSNLLNISGAGIVSVGVGAGSLTISATTPSVTNYSTISGSVAGNVGATTTFTIGNQLQISAAGILSATASGSSITLSAPAAAAGTVISAVQISGNTSGTSSLISNGTVYLQAISNIGLSQSTTTGANSTTSNVISIFGPTYSAGVGLAVSTTGGVISYAAPNAAVTSNVLNAFQISGNTSGTSSLIQTGTIYLQAVSLLGLSQSTTTGVNASTSNVVSIFGPAYAAAGGLALSTTGGSVSYSITNHVSSVNGSSGTLSVSAGAGIGIGNANSTITISASVQTSSLSVTALGNTLGAASTSLAVSNALNISGAGIVSVGMNGSTITISATSAAVTNFSTISGSITGNTAGTGTFTIGTGINISLTGGLSGTASGSSITLSAAGAGVNYSTITATMAGNTLGAASTTLTIGNSLSVSGGGQVSVGASAGTITISGGSSLVAGANISLTSGGSSITIIGTSPRISFTQNFPLVEASPVQIGTLTTTGTSAASAANNPFGSSLSIQRIYIPSGGMSLTEVDLAFGISFPATNQGQGSMSQSMIIYTFGNSTSLGSLLSTSRAVTWATGTTTSGTSSSLQQGWASNQIQPFTFASTTLPTGEYAVAHLLSWAAASTSWTVSVFGHGGSNTVAASAATNLTSATLGALSSGGLAAVSAFTGTTNITLSSMSIAAGSAITAITQNATNNVSWFVSRATSAVTSVASSTSSFTFLEAPFVGSLGTVAGSIITGSTAQTAISAAGYSAGSFVGTSGSVGAVTNVALGALNSTTLLQSVLPSFQYNGSVAMTTNATVASFLNGVFTNGIMSTGSAPASIDLRSTAVTVTGSTALIQPWFALLGN